MIQMMIVSIVTGVGTPGNNVGVKSIGTRLRRKMTTHGNCPNCRRYAAMLYSVVKRYGTDWNLYLEGVGDDILPEKLFAGWNLVGEDAIITILHGDSLRVMEEMMKEVTSEGDEGVGGENRQTD